MNNIHIKTSSKVIPMCYAYSTPEIKRHDGWVKIGYTEKQDVDERIKQQSHTVDVETKEEWRGNAIFEDGSGEYFKDTDFHNYLKKNGIEYDGEKKNEWFHIDGPNSKAKFIEFKDNHGLSNVDTITPYILRDEQNKAVLDTIKYKNNHTNKSEYLWNCKPRFGKTLSAYDLVQKLACHRVLIVTNRPAIANSWYNDYCEFIGDDFYYFVSETDALRGKKHVLSIKDFNYKESRIGKDEIGRIEFISLQDLKGSIYFGGNFDKLKHVKDLEWDLLIIDEAHEGVDTYKTDVAFDKINRKFTLHLSGTPFKAIASNKFNEDAVYSWTYADEQKKKTEWKSPDRNPYEDLPRLNLYTYQMSEIVKDELKEGISINDEVEEYAFDLNEFFATNDNGTFVHDSAVDKFLNALVTQTKFPFSTPELRDELKHTFWLLDRVASVNALRKKLENHPIFKDYQIISAVGNKSDDSELTRKSYNRVKYCIENFDKTITLSVGQLTTGVTIPEWTGVLMLCNCKSPSLYMQAAFRAQNPCMFRKENEFYRKENSYVFDFDPARTLIIFEEFANDLISKTARGGGSIEERKHNVRELLNFFPVIGEDENGEMVELDAEKVLTIPRKIKSSEVVKKGFMSNFLFQNIGNIFNAPKELLKVLEKFNPVSESKQNNKKIQLPTDVNVNENGEVEISNELIVGKTQDIFGEKIYGDITELTDSFVNDNQINYKISNEFDELKENLNKVTIDAINSKLDEFYSDKNLTKSDKKIIERGTKAEIEYQINALSQKIKIDENVLENDYQQAIDDLPNSGKTKEQIDKEHEEKLKELSIKTKEAINDTVLSLTKTVTESAIETAEKKIQEHEVDTVEDKVRDHLRGFSRTIPSFLMAYGDDKTTLENFDRVIPDKVFKEVTSVSLDEFRMLRDGGNFTDDQGNTKHFDGLFDAVVFDDSIKVFLKKKEELSNYFDETATEDIFDYIPPQKTNQIYTPKKVVKMMVDMLEKENPGCFDKDDETFADLYMKSGLYIAEIVKRLYRNNYMKKKYPDRKARLEHIFEKQVYGCAPTEIIYNIAKNFILGFDKNFEIKKHNLRLFDTLPYAEDGTLESKLDKIFGDTHEK